jgi:hypothetical protein
VLLLVGDQLVQGSIYRLLAEHADALFGDDYFADLFNRSALGRPTSAPPTTSSYRLTLKPTTTIPAAPRDQAPPHSAVSDFPIA